MYKTLFFQRGLPHDSSWTWQVLGEEGRVISEGTCLSRPCAVLWAVAEKYRLKSLDRRYGPLEKA